MKTDSIKNKVLLIFLLSFSHFFAQTNAEKKYPEPEFENKVYLYDESSNTIKDLTTCTVEYFEQNNIVSGTTTGIIGIKGEKSATRLSLTQKPKFIVMVSPNDLDKIQEMFQLVKFSYNKKKDRREILEKNADSNKIFFKNKKVFIVKPTGENAENEYYWKHIFILTPEGLEALGEYIWKTDMANGTCFGID